MFVLDDPGVNDNIHNFLCIYKDSVEKHPLINDEFSPQSFTVRDKRLNNPILFFNDISYDEWIEGLVSDIVSRLEFSETEKEQIKKQTISNFTTLLNYQFNGAFVESQIFNQELVDVLRKVVSYTVTGDSSIDLHVSKDFNNLALKIMPIVIKLAKSKSLSNEELLKISIASGMAGLDLKGAPSAASTYANQGIAMKQYYTANLSVAASELLGKILDIVETSKYPFFQWEEFLSDLRICKKIAWLTDDYIESFFDLLFIERILEQYKDLKIEIIPKNGYYGNDLSWVDLYNIIDLPIFSSLKKMVGKGHLLISKSGPKMGAANLYKLSKRCVDSIVSSDVIVQKGCRIHEMLQGGISKDMYSAFIVSRTLSEATTGLDSNEYPIVFFKLKKRESAYFGLHPQNAKTITFPSGKRLTTCLSTLSDHERRVNMTSAKQIIAEIKLLQDEESSYIGNKKPLYEEMNLLAEKLVDITRQTYNATCETYKKVRTNKLGDVEQTVWDTLVSYIERYISKNPSDINLLDVGASNGRDVLYATKLGYTVHGIDNSDGFIRILKEYEDRGDLAKNSIHKCDMRDLCFEDNSFDVIRHHATLLHLPIIAPGYMLDLALSESYRVLKPNGLLFAIVKTGEGLDITDTEEGMGGRIYQFFTHKTLNEMFMRNGFVIVQTSDELSIRKSGPIEWIAIIVQKQV